MYERFAEVYDTLMDDFNYPEWAEYYMELIRRAGIEPKRMAECGCGSDAEMEALAPKALWEGWDRVKKRTRSLQAIMPVIDGEIIPDLPQAVFRAGKELDVPVLLGVTS